MATNNNEEFKMDILMKIHREEQTRGGEKIGETRLQVVKYSRGEPRLEKRNYYCDKAGELKMGKLTGLQIADFEIIEEKWSKIEQALKGKQISKVK